MDTQESQKIVILILNVDKKDLKGLFLSFCELKSIHSYPTIRLCVYTNRKTITSLFHTSIVQIRMHRIRFAWPLD